MMSRPSAWQRDWAVAPGELLAEALEERGISQSELARRMSRPIKTINEIVNGKAALTAETAVQLELVLGISAGFWNGLEASYREQLARNRALEELEAHADWVDAFPLKDLVRHNLVRTGPTKGATAAALLAFFGVSAPSAWEREWLRPIASFRASQAFAPSPHAVAAWLRWGDIQASRIDVQTFDAARFRGVLQEIRSLSRRAPFVRTLARVRELCAASGVALVLTPELTGTRLSGAARWASPTKAIIQLSLRHKSDDQFWFSFFHEAGHLLTGRRQGFIDAADTPIDSGDEEERRADQFARDTLLPAKDYQAFVDARNFSHQAVRSFARAQGLAPGIVVGRLQRDDHLDPAHLNDLKRSIHWADPL